MTRCFVNSVLTRQSKFKRLAIIQLIALSVVLIAPLHKMSAKAAGCSNENALGVSRTVVIDTANGPKYGLQQYKQHDFLRKKEVVLTFDDGPAAIYTNPILKALAHHCTKATFFMVGQMARSNPALVRKVAALGHTVGTHSWSHQNLGRRSQQKGIKEIELAVSVISKALGRPAAPFFRFPYLSDPKRMIKHLQERNIGIFSIDVDSKDFRTRNGSTVIAKVMRGLRREGKGIILFHDIQKSSARALPGLLKKLKAKGYKVVHLKAKTQGVTLAEYDLAAEKLFKRKTAGAAHRAHRKSTSRRTSRRTVAKRATTRRARARKRPKSARRRARKKYSKTAKSNNRNTWSANFFQGG